MPGMLALRGVRVLLLSWPLAQPIRAQHTAASTSSGARRAEVLCGCMSLTDVDSECSRYLQLQAWAGRRERFWCVPAGLHTWRMQPSQPAHGSVALSRGSSYDHAARAKGELLSSRIDADDYCTATDMMYTLCACMHAGAIHCSRQHVLKIMNISASVSSEAVSWLLSGLLQAVDTHGPGK